MVVHPAPGNYKGHLSTPCFFIAMTLQESVEKRPGIVHRLDKGTTGVMAVAKSAKAHEGMSKLFAEHDIERIYETIVPAKAFPLLDELKAPLEGTQPPSKASNKCQSR